MGDAAVRACVRGPTGSPRRVSVDTSPDRARCSAFRCTMPPARRHSALPPPLPTRDTDAGPSASRCALESAQCSSSSSSGLLDRKPRPGTPGTRNAERQPPEPALVCVYEYVCACMCASVRVTAIRPCQEVHILVKEAPQGTRRARDVFWATFKRRQPRHPNLTR
ncbi:hypothetical protein PLESTM_000978800 [Pleodorina starrii]|nr:hypothetical protein PLESTM_000978800 [Pleodorina starrii]